MDTLTLFAHSHMHHDMQPTATDAAATTVIFGVFMLFALAMIVISYAVYAFFLGRIFKKAGVEQWRAWVPIYSTWKLLELGGQQGFWAVLALIPIVNIVAGIFIYIAMYHIGLKLQKDGWFVLLAIFLSPVWFIWLALDDSKWKAAPTKTASAA